VRQSRQKVTPLASQSIGRPYGWLAWSLPQSTDLIDTPLEGSAVPLRAVIMR